MKKLTNLCNHNFLITATILFITTIFFTLDSFCYNTITTAFDIINIGGIRMEAMDFVYILFSLTCLVGIALGFLFRKFSKAYTSIMSLLTGVILLLISFLDVDLLQSLLPTMRISHVIMTLSQITIIVFGATGLMIGANIAYIINNKTKFNLTHIFATFVISIALSLFAISEGLYTLIYGAIAMFIILGTIVFQYNKETITLEVSHTKLDTNNILALSGNAFSVAALTLVFGTMYNYLINTVAISIIGYTLIMAITLISVFIGCRYLNATIPQLIAWSITAILCVTTCFVQTIVLSSLTLIMLGLSLGACWTPTQFKISSSIINSGTVTLFSIISLVIIKLLSQEIKHSNNRIYYKVDATVFAIILSLLLISLTIKVTGKIIAYKKITAK